MPYRNPEYKKLQSRKYYLLNKEKIQKYREEHKEEKSNYNKEYHKSHKQEINPKARKRAAIRYKVKHAEINLKRRLNNDNRRKKRIQKYSKGIGIRTRVITPFGRAEVKAIPRIGVCNFCRAVAKIDCAYTHFAHFSYDKTDLSKNILELCPRCHKYMDGFVKDTITGAFVTNGGDLSSAA